MIKTRSKANLIRSLGSNEAWPSRSDRIRRAMTTAGMFRGVDRIEKVSKADIRRVANQTFVPGNRTVGIIEFAPPRDRCANIRLIPCLAFLLNLLRLVLLHKEVASEAVFISFFVLVLFVSGNVQLWAQAATWQQVPISPLPPSTRRNRSALYCPTAWWYSCRKITNCL